MLPYYVQVSSSPYPVEGHVGSIFKNKVIWMAQNVDVPKAQSAPWTKMVQNILRVG